MASKFIQVRLNQQSLQAIQIKNDRSFPKKIDPQTEGVIVEYSY